MCRYEIRCFVCRFCSRWVRRFQAGGSGVFTVRDGWGIAGESAGEIGEGYRCGFCDLNVCVYRHLLKDRIKTHKRRMKMQQKVMREILNLVMTRPAAHFDSAREDYKDGICFTYFDSIDAPEFQPGGSCRVLPAWRSHPAAVVQSMGYQ